MKFTLLLGCAAGTFIVHAASNWDCRENIWNW